MLPGRLQEKNRERIDPPSPFWAGRGIFVIQILKLIFKINNEVKNGAHVQRPTRSSGGVVKVFE